MEIFTLRINLLIIAIVSVLVSIRFSIVESKSCVRYRTGTFYYHFNAEGKQNTYKIIRTDSVQTEINNEGNDSSTYKINWIDSCSYELRFIKGTEVLSEKLLALKKKMIVRTTILSGTKEYYLFRSTGNLINDVLSDTMWVKNVVTSSK